MMSSAGPANARPLKARVALQAAIVEINFMLVSFEACCEMLIARPGLVEVVFGPQCRRILRLGLMAVEPVNKEGDVEIRRSVLVPYSAEAMFDLIEQAEFYPSFRPWCTAAEILERSDDWVAARLEFSYLSLRFTMRTRNPKRRPEWLQVRMEEGPFKQFHGDWRLVPLADQGCRVAFDLSYQFSEGLVDQVAKVALGRIFGSVVESFVKRAEATLTPC
jgi:ribosome-associated toxin RatA of RatAB toxin-antitoxin module